MNKPVTEGPSIDIDDDELVRRFPGEPITHDNAGHYRGRLRRELLLNRCCRCGTWHQPHKPVCPACWSGAVVPTPVAGTGTIHLAIFLHQGPPAEGVDYRTPYPVVTVELDEQAGLRFTSTVADADNDQIIIGRRVALAWRTRHGSPLPVFTLVEEAAPR
ncbi:Zn-ribbon domain-containing OB-fold protein [[Mycobacterium] vasticus]|uniref:OB-fold domain-containing protein n=1 Tax=[Mycobacterium] vasticus TaxID=2875777 RepID=A0ABU5Z2R3_9MYCO|nr:OB-fold domain-containing protein [Mycolicibacter sp. MYC017]MEB3071692.1 OB-fold domain-containing protein [Mycolicibacter sp. MYC017]